MQNTTILDGILADARDRSVYVLETAYRKMRACACAAHSCSAFRCFPLCLYRRRHRHLHSSRKIRRRVREQQVLCTMTTAPQTFAPNACMHVFFFLFSFFTKRIWLFSSCGCLPVTHSSAMYTHCFAPSR